MSQRHGALASIDAVGFQDLESNKPMRTDSIFQIMSMTKPVTAVGIMILMEEGRLALSDPVEKHLQEFRNQWVLDSSSDDKARTLHRPARPITIRDLLTHTSGMLRWLPEWTKEFDPILLKPLSEVVSMAAQYPLEFEPGSKWQYSASAAFATLGRIIEVVSDQPYERFMEERILRPLGMKDSFFFPPPDRHARIASVYVMEEGKLKKRTPIGNGDLYRTGAKNPFPEGGLYSTAQDLAAFYQMMLNGGALNGKRILSRSTVDLMTADHTKGLNTSFGLGWAVVRETGALPLASEGTFSHGGAFGTFGWIDRKKDLVGVFLVQRPGADTERNAFMAMAASAIVD